MKETSSRDRRGLLVGGLSAWAHRHGRTEFSAFLFTPSGAAWPSMHQMLVRLHALRAETVAITDRRNPAAANRASRAISIPARIPEIYSPIPYIIPAQLFAAALAKREDTGPRPPACPEQGHPKICKLSTSGRIISCASDPPSKPNHARRCSLSAGGGQRSPERARFLSGKTTWLFTGLFRHARAASGLRVHQPADARRAGNRAAFARACVSARAGKPSASIRLRNLKRLTPSFSIELSGRGDADNTPSILKNPVYFPLVPGHTTIEAAVQVVFPYPRPSSRKSVRNLDQVPVRFPAQKHDRRPAPRDYRVPGARTPRGRGDPARLGFGRDGIARPRRRTRLLPHPSLRGPGQRARHVDWKSSAHTGGLQVREFTRDQQRIVEVFFDRRIVPGQQPRFEELVENCAFFVWQLADRDARLWVRSQRFGAGRSRRRVRFTI